MIKHLYVVKFRGAKVEPRGELTDLDRYHGWRDRNQDGEPVTANFNGVRRLAVVNEGHELFSLRKMTGPHVLTWKPGPGDQVEAVIEVYFSQNRATYEAYTTNAFQQYFLVRCETVLGRPVGLGEDGAEDAFGNDAIRETVGYALRRDWRSVQCELQVTMVGDDDPLPDSVSVTIQDEQVGPDRLGETR